MDSTFKMFTDKIIKKEKDIEAYENKIDEGNETIEAIKREITNVEKEKDAYGKKAALANSKYLQSL